MSDEMFKWIIGGLATAIFAIWKVQQSTYKKADEERRKEKAEDKAERQEMYDKLQAKNEQMYNEGKERHAKEESELKKEIADLHIREEKRDKDWLNALNNNTNQLKNMADKLQIIPTIQKDVDGMKEDIEEIKNKIN
jgi:hypothetical protein